MNIRMRDLAPDQVERAFQLACREADIDPISHSLSALELFKLMALAESAILTIVRADSKGREIRP